MKKSIVFLISLIAIWQSGAAQALVNGTFQANYNSTVPVFDPERAFEQSLVPGWTYLHGSPSIHDATGNPHAYMWAHSGRGEGIMQVLHMGAQCYEIGFRIKTNDNGSNDPNVGSATVHLASAKYVYRSSVSSEKNPMYVGVNGSTSHGFVNYPNFIWASPASQFFGNNWHHVSLVFKNPAPSNAEHIIFYPKMDVASTNNSQLNMYLDDVTVVPLTTGTCAFQFENQSGTPKTQFQVNENVYLNGSASTNEENYFIAISSRPRGSSGPFVWANSLGWSSGQIGTVNLSALFAANNFTFAAGMEYEVKLATQNLPCFNWVETVHTFEVDHFNATYIKGE